MADMKDTRRIDLGLLQQLEQTVWGRALSCCNKTYGLRMSFGLDCRTQVILEEICIHCTGHSVPPGHVVFQNYPSFIPKESQHNLSRRWLGVEFFRFW